MGFSLSCTQEGARKLGPNQYSTHWVFSSLMDEHPRVENLKEVMKSSSLLGYMLIPVSPERKPKLRRVDQLALAQWEEVEPGLSGSFCLADMLPSDN